MSSAAEAHRRERVGRAGDVVGVVARAARADHHDHPGRDAATVQGRDELDRVHRCARLLEPRQEARVAGLEADVDAAQAERLALAPVVCGLALAGPRVDEREQRPAGKARGHLSQQRQQALLREAERVGVADEHGAAQRERRPEVPAQRVEVTRELVLRLEAERHVAVQRAERARVPGAALGEADDEREVLVGRQDADAAAGRGEARGVLREGRRVHRDDRSQAVDRERARCGFGPAAERLRRQHREARSRPRARGLDHGLDRRPGRVGGAPAAESAVASRFSSSPPSRPRLYVPVSRTSA